MNIQSWIILLVLVAAFVGAVVFISKNGGWSSGGCGGDCAHCGQGCATPAEKAAAKKNARKK